jgi:GDP-L-fucose synthase
MVQANFIEAALRNGVKKLLFLGSNCIYPRISQQLMREEASMTSTLVPTNESYAIAKIAGIKLCESYNRQYGVSHGVDYRSVMPTNLFGLVDNYHPKNSHVIPALIRRFHEAKVANVTSLAIWGTATPRREFLYLDDMAAASVHVMKLPKAVYDQHTSPMQSHINVGSGADVTIAEVAQAIDQTIGFIGHILNSTPHSPTARHKWMDSSRLNALGWQVKVGLQEGLAVTNQNFLII